MSRLPASAFGGTSVQTDKALLGADYNSLTGKLSIPVSERGKGEIQKVLGKIYSGEYVYEDKPCFCGEIREELICTVDRYRLPHRSVMCPSCGLIRTNPRLNRASYVDFYTHHYRGIYERPGHSSATLFSLQARRSEERAAFVLKHSSLPVGARVLELGCGGGWNLIPFSKMGFAVQGYDYDEDYMTAGRQHGLTLDRGGVDDALAVGRTFDLVILSHVLEHILDPKDEVCRIMRLLSPSGLLYIEVPNLFAVTTDLPRYWQNAHTYSFVPETVTALMTQSGYSAVAMNHVVASLWRRSSTMTQFTSRAEGNLAERTRRFLVASEGKAKLKNRLSWLHHLWVWLHSLKS